MKLIVHTDGGSRGNPGPAAIGVTMSLKDRPLYTISEFIGITTNNVAEYTAILRALEYLQKSPPPLPTHVEFYLDSLLVVSQLTGKFAVKHVDMRTLFSRVRAVLTALPYPVSFTYVPREQNQEADTLVNIALDNHSKESHNS